MSIRHAVRAFYAVVLATALTGASTAAAGWLNWHIGFAVVVVAAVELGGVVLSMHAAARRQLGEGALASRLLSAAVAAMAVSVNWFGHAHHQGQAAFFAGMSLLGYCVYLIDSSAGRRDALRAAGKLEDTSPAYGLWQWVSHPGITRRARLLAQANAAVRLAEGPHPTTPRLARMASLAAAREQVRAERRQAAISTSLRERIAKAAGDKMADIAVHTYDLDEVARRLAAGADYDGLTALLAADLTAAKLTGDRPAPDPKPEPIQATVSRRPAAELDRVWSTIVRDYEPAQRALPASAPEPAHKPTNGARVIATKSRRVSRATAAVEPAQARLATAYPRLRESLGREPSGAELAGEAKVSKATANKWKTSQSQTES